LTILAWALLITIGYLVAARRRRRATPTHIEATVAPPETLVDEKVLEGAK
jgi:hypothetical protein